MIKRIPNILSFSRLIAAPVLVLVAAVGTRTSFLVLAVAMTLTDALDGYLARKLKAESDFGRKLDSWADYATLASVAAGLWLLWPELVRRELPWFASGIFGCFAVAIYGLVRWRTVPGYHTWLAKAVGVTLPLSVLPMLAEWSAAPFHYAVVLSWVCATEEFAIALLLPGYSGHVPSVWHARKLAQGPRPAGAAGGTGAGAGAN